jgi:hypothetical protein
MARAVIDYESVTTGIDSLGIRWYKPVQIV